ncbi:MAG TPA: hypothetical protein DCS93_37060 [Microscillaceae bacterium]|nr:hypothetical protein [Microscillaceae bacterium]
MEAIKQKHADLEFYQERSQRLNYWVDYQQVLGADASALPLKSEILSKSQTSQRQTKKPPFSLLAKLRLWTFWIITALLFISMAFSSKVILPLIGILSLWVSLSVTHTTDQATKLNK